MITLYVNDFFNVFARERVKHADQIEADLVEGNDGRAGYLNTFSDGREGGLGKEEQNAKKQICRTYTMRFCLTLSVYRSNSHGNSATSTNATTLTRQYLLP